jgi:hypothetical protein
MEYRLRWESDNLDKEKIFRCDSIEEAQNKFLSASKEVKKERIIAQTPNGKEYLDPNALPKSSSDIVVPNISDQTQQESLLSHRDNLRGATAYPILRVINLLNSVAIVILSLLWGNEAGREQGLIIFGIVGVIIAILSYSLTSVFFDVADSNINTSRNSEGKS